MAESRKPNDQYNLTQPGSLAERVGGHVRKQMFSAFMHTLLPEPGDTVLDVGVTGDRDYTVSNYFEALYPYKAQVTAAGIDDASFLETVYPGMRFVSADALDLPFADNEFDLVHSSAVLEHVGSSKNQRRMIEECLRVARRGIFVTTPNRWFPIEFHTQLPLVHWLPPETFRSLLRRMGYDFFAEEKNLNLMTRRQLRSITAERYGWRFEVATARLMGWTSNLIFVARREG